MQAYTRRYFQLPYWKSAARPPEAAKQGFPRLNAGRRLSVQPLHLRAMGPFMKSRRVDIKKDHSVSNRLRRFRRLFDASSVSIDATLGRMRVTGATRSPKTERRTGCCWARGRASGPLLLCV